MILDNSKEPATNSSGKKYNTHQNLKALNTAIAQGERECVRVEIATQMINEYKIKHPKTQYKSLQGLKHLLCTLIKDRKSIALTDLTEYFTVKTIKKITDQLALIYPKLIETRSGMSVRKKGSPSFMTSPVIHLTSHAIKYLYDDWLNYKNENKGNELDLINYNPRLGKIGYRPY